MINNNIQVLFKKRFVMALYVILDPLPFGLFFAGMIFDIVYVNSFNPLWIKGAAWLILLGLLMSIIPRLLMLAFLLRSPTFNLNSLISYAIYAFGIILSLWNSFIHARDAYGSMPSGLILSVCSVIAVAVAVSLQPLTAFSYRSAVNN